MRKRPQKSTTYTESQPAVLPVIVIDQAETGDEREALYRVTMTDPRTDAVVADSLPARRLGTAVGRLVEDAGSAVRVEVHQRDGSVYADVIHPPAPEPNAAAVDADVDAVDRTVVGGFLPGEQVLVAIVVHTAYADHHGRLHLPLDALPNLADQLQVGANDQFVVVGATSHVAATRRP